MRSTIPLVMISALLALACTPSAVDTEYKTTMLMLPEGEPEAGRDAFMSLGCAGCHTVAWDEELPSSAAASLGPELGLDVEKLGPGGLATSVIAPSHKVSAKYQEMTGSGASPMRDYSREMTIRQLADIVAYLERQGLKTQAKTGMAMPG
jgi:mono/diheme cytochrome c family protein